jgi:hypothetical protein
MIQPHLQVCVACLEEVVLNKRPLTFTTTLPEEMNVPPGTCVMELNRSLTAQRYFINAAETTVFDGVTAEGMMSIVNALYYNGIPGIFKVDGEFRAPHMTTLFEGSAMCGSHLMDCIGDIP